MSTNFIFEVRNYKKRTFFTARSFAFHKHRLMAFAFFRNGEGAFRINRNFKVKKKKICIQLYILLSSVNILQLFQVFLKKNEITTFNHKGT